MTKEEAIFCEKSYLGETNCIDCKYYGTDTCESRESHKMAISALEQEQKDDELAKEVIDNALKIKDEPCVTSTDEPMTMVYPTIFSDDAISREEALKETDYLTDDYGDMHEIVYVDRLIKLPSVQPSECEECGKKANAIAKYSYDYGKQDGKRNGHWIDDKNLVARRCSQCDWWYRDWTRYKFCPNCGTDMRGGSK